MAITAQGKPASEHRLCKKLTTHIAWAMILFTLILIVLIHGFHIGKNSILPYFGLVIAVFGMIPLFRSMQRRWEGLTNSGLAEAGLETRIRTDIIKLWAMAIIIPCAWALVLAAVTGTG